MKTQEAHWLKVQLN